MAKSVLYCWLDVCWCTYFESLNIISCIIVIMCFVIPWVIIIISSINIILLKQNTQCMRPQLQSDIWNVWSTSKILELWNSGKLTSSLVKYVAPNALTIIKKCRVIIYTANCNCILLHTYLFYMYVVIIHVQLLYFSMHTKYIGLHFIMQQIWLSFKQQGPYIMSGSYLLAQMQHEGLCADC